MLTATLIIAALGLGVLLGAKLVFGNATKPMYIAASGLPVLIGFLLIRFDNDAETLQSGQMELAGLPLLGFLLVMIGLLSGVTIAVIGIASTMVQISKRGRK